jgi:3-oxoacyl-[acyl-carrier protein] reductase
MNINKVINKVAVVTGSARGIGRAIALRLAKEGYTLAINTKSSVGDMERTLEEIKLYSPSSIAYQADVSDYAQAQAFFELVKRELGSCDVLVNNAGISYIGLFNTMSPSDYQSIMKTNVDGVLNCTHLALQYMVAKHSGCIINISSMWGISGASCEAVYSASKGAVNAFTKALAKELAPSNIFVNAIACGAIDTKMNSFMDEEERAAFTEEIPLGRFGTADEVAGLALYLAKDNTYITGQIISLDGGMM